jgi:hypothetical protein
VTADDRAGIPQPHRGDDFPVRTVGFLDRLVFIEREDAEKFLRRLPLVSQRKHRRIQLVKALECFAVGY